MIEALGFSINLTVIILSKIRNNLCLYSHLKVCLQEKIPTCNNLKTCIILKNCVAQDSIPRIVVIFPTNNEEDTLEHVIRTAKKSQHNPEKLIAKPMISVFFPELSHFEQPLSGEVCARTEVWKRLLDQNPPDGWGIDVWILIEAAMAGYQIKEIYLGTKEHTSFEDYREDLGKLAKMAEQVEFTILKEAVKYRRIERHKDVKTDYIWHCFTNFQ